MAAESIWNREIHLWFLPKPRLKWREPKAFLRNRDAEARAHLRWWFQPLIVLVAAALLMGNWYLGRLNPHKHPPPFHLALILSPLGGIFFAYILPWLLTFCPSEVRLYEAYITRVRGNNNQRLRYADIEYFAWRMTDGMNTLVVKGRKSKREMVMGVPTEISKNDVHLFLLSKDAMLQPGV